MEDKQIIIDDYFIKIVDINDKLVAYEIKNSKLPELVKKIEKQNEYIKCKEQECEELKERLNCNCFDPKNNNNRCISYNRIAEDYERDLKQLDQLKAENDELKEYIKHLHNLCGNETDKQYEYKQTLTEIKSILELYANPKVGEEQSDGSYKLSSGLCGIQDSFGFRIITYDPRPARQALQKINECGVEK